MSDSDHQPTPTNDSSGDTPTTKPAGSANAKKRKAKRGPASPRASVNVDRSTPLHQSRVFAMQALYEDDLTHHGLDEILQHVGIDRRRELIEFFADIEEQAGKIIETVAYLARNADSDHPAAAMTTFNEAADKAIRGLTESEEPVDRDLADTYLSIVRNRIEAAVNRMLARYRDGMETRLREALTEIAQTPPAVSLWDDEDDKPSGLYIDEKLTALETDTARDLKTTIANEERESLSTLMDILRRTEVLARGVESNLAEIDPYIEKAAPAFPIPQLASIDRAVLRVAVYELFYQPEVPFKVAINEAVEVSKHFGGPNSGKFVNGVLRTISGRLPEERRKSPAKA